MPNCVHKMRLLLCLTLVLALVSFALPPPLVQAATGEAPTFSSPFQEGEALVFTPPVTGASAFAAMRIPASAFATFVSEASGVPVVTFATTDYGNTLLGLEKGEYDIVYLPAPLMVKAAAEVGAMPVYNVVVGGDAKQSGQIVVPADSEVSELSELAGKLIGAANLDSAAAWTLPAAALKEAGVNPFRDIDAQFTDSDAASILGVLAGELDAAFVLSGAMEDEAVLAEAPDAAERLKVLAEYEGVPVGAIAIRAGLAEADVEALKAAFGDAGLVNAMDEEGNSVLGGMGWEGLVPAAEGDYAAVYEAAATLGMIPATE